MGVNVLLYKRVLWNRMIYWKYKKTLILMLCAQYKFFIYRSLDIYDSKLHYLQFFLNQLSTAGTMQLLYFKLVLLSRTFLLVFHSDPFRINPLNPELNPICYLLALLGAHHFLYVSRIKVKSLTLRRLMSYIYGAPILDVSRSHTTTQHSR